MSDQQLAPTRLQFTPVANIQKRFDTAPTDARDETSTILEQENRFLKATLYETSKLLKISMRTNLRQNMIAEKDKINEVLLKLEEHLETLDQFLGLY